VRRELALFCALMAAGLILAATPHVCAQIPPATLAQANAALQAGEADKAITLLAPLPTSGPGAAEAQNLLCRVHFTLQQWEPATRECEQAVRLSPGNSNNHLWLGRALGGKAEHVSFLTAYSLGKRVRAEFEEAVRLDPHNAAALSDLGEFYKEAPGIVGGGTDKAASVADRLDKIDSARAHQLRGYIAETRKDFGSAEREFRQAIATGIRPAAQWVNLAIFYRNRHRWSEMEAAVQSCANTATHERNSGVALYDGAGILIETNRNPAFAAKMLESYLASPAKAEEAPAFIAHGRLGRLKQQMGDAGGAKREFAAAYALAHAYRPPQDSRH